MGLPKALAGVVLPLGLVTILLAFALWALHRRRLPPARAAVITVVALLWIGGMPATARWLAGTLETRHPPVAPGAISAAPAIVVLGGGVAVAGPDGAAVPGPEAVRAWAAVTLFKAGKAPLIVVSGGGERPEAPLVAELLGEWAVPPSALVVEPASRSTRENALATRGALEGRAIDRIVLVTTATHMKRAAAAFAAAGFDVVPFPVGFASPDEPLSPPILRWAPTAEALAETTAALLELAAGLYYRLRGWA